MEFEFIAHEKHDRPNAFELTATFTGPDGAEFQQPAFWDGGSAWKVRFAPTAVGEWSYATVCEKKSDAGLCGRTGAFRVAPPRDDNPIFARGGFLRVSENRRFLTYSDGTPFFWLGDTWWFCPSTRCPIEGSSTPLHASMFRDLIDLRRRQGFTVVQMAFLDGRNSLNVEAHPHTWTEPNLEYWRLGDEYINYANAAGIIPVVGIGFHKNLDNVSGDHLQRLWRYVIARYGAFAVTWLIVGEYNLDNDPSRVEKTLALGRFIKQLDPYKRAMTVHPWVYAREKRQSWDEPWNDFIMTQCGHDALPPAEFYLDIYRRSSPKPLLEGECLYEGINGKTADQVRRAAYRAIQAGSFGYTYGAHGLWYPTQSGDDRTFSEYGRPIPWWEAAGRRGGSEMQLLREIYESVPWWQLEPRPDAVELEQAVSEEERALTKAKGTEIYVIYFPRAVEPLNNALLPNADPEASYIATWMSPVKRMWVLPNEPLRAGDRGLRLPARPGPGDWVLILHKTPSTSRPQLH